ncbi:MAG: ATP-dependent zinc metalloprotease FtsH [Elusimicrobiota bacterium]|jgi:cell division protease FtsH|nr:ATP-dependent zinc metalloprotease FtsH [Elusimicrobiota bacterium]MDR0734659.1 ATP-dependent zinc metalloprotease FtsH [Elusimicrobiota bacterium]
MKVNNKKPIPQIPWRQVLLWVIIFIMMVSLYSKMGQSQAAKDMDYSEFRAKIASGDILKVSVGQDSIAGTFKDDGKESKFKTPRIPDDNDLVRDLVSAKIPFKGETDKSWIYSLLMNVGWIALFFAAWYFLFIRPQKSDGKSALNFAKSKAKLQDPQEQNITFKDVAGVEEAKEEVQDIIKFLRNPKHFQKLGAKLPKGVLLYGAPGTGKTLLAKAVAGEAKVAFFSASASEFVEMFVGVGAARVRDLFNNAKKNAPAIIFVDELDAVGRRRFAGIGGGHDEREQTLNQLLIELDGFESKQGILLMASTNRPDVLDPALTRPGRFDRHINIPAPDMKGRKEILEVHAKKVKMAQDVDLETIAKGTPGFVGADLANVINEAAILAARHDKEAVGTPDIEEAVERVMAGPQRKSRIISDKEKRVIAAHEAGHTIIAKKSQHSDPVHKVSIIPRGPALGYTLQLPLEDKYLVSKSEILDRLTVLLGGRAAEDILFGEITTGAHDDLSRTTAYARKMVAELGMSDKLGPISVQTDQNEVFLGMEMGRHKNYSEDLAKEIDNEVSLLVKESYNKAKEILRANKTALETLIARLIEKEVVEAAEIDEILGIKKEDKKTDSADIKLEQSPVCGPAGVQRLDKEQGEAND